MNMGMPLDVRRNWLNVARRLQSMSRSKGLSLITVTILVDKEGDPLFWTEPKQTLIEPAAFPKDRFLDIIASLNGNT